MTQSAADPILRPLGAWEELYWRYSQAGPRAFSYAMEVAGFTSPDQWRAALDQMQRGQPLFSASIHQSGDQPPVFLPTLERIPLRIEKLDECRWEEEVAREIDQRFNGSERPLIRAVLLHSAQRSILILTCHHSVSDGASMSAALVDVLNVISGGVARAHPLPPSIEEQLLIPRQSSHNLPRASEDPGPPMHVRIADAVPAVRSLRLSSMLTGKISHACHQNRVTVHGAILAAATLAAYRVFPEFGSKPIRLLSNIDPRRHLSLAAGSAMYFSATISTADPFDPPRFWDEAGRLSILVKGHATREIISGALHAITNAVVSGISSEGAIDFLRYGMPHEMIISNVGKINDPMRKGIYLESMWGPAFTLGMKDERVLGVTTVNNRIHLLLTTTSAADPGFLEGIEQHLQSAVSSS